MASDSTRLVIGGRAGGPVGASQYGTHSLDRARDAAPSQPARGRGMRTAALLLTLAAVGMLAAGAGSRAARPNRGAAVVDEEAPSASAVAKLLDSLHALLGATEKGGHKHKSRRMGHAVRAQDVVAGPPAQDVGCGQLDLGPRVQVHCSSFETGAVCHARCEGDVDAGEKYMCSALGMWQKVYNPRTPLLCLNQTATQEAYAKAFAAVAATPGGESRAATKQPGGEEAWLLSALKVQGASSFTVMTDHACNVDPHQGHLGAMGGVTPMTTATDEHECLHECLHHPQCAEFEFQEVTVGYNLETRCWLHRTFSEPTPAEGITCGFVSGVRPCDGAGFPPGACDCEGSVLDECGVCGGAGIPEGQCDCFGNVTDVCDVCGGDGIPEGHCDCEGTLMPEGHCDCNGTRFDDCGVCGGPGIVEGTCDCEGHLLDECGVCGGNSTIPEGFCDCHGARIPEGMCDCAGRVLDVCGVCGGPGITDECGVCGGPGIPEGQCDCFGNVTDACGVCGGPGIPEGQCDCNGTLYDECGVCGGVGVDLHAGKCDCAGNTLDACNVCGGPGIPEGHCDCEGTLMPEGHCDCNGNVMDACGVCGGPGLPEGQCDCLGNVTDSCGICGGPGYVADNPTWQDTYGDGCERYARRPEFCGFEDSVNQCQSACRVCPAILAVHDGQLSMLNHANIHMGGNEKPRGHYSHCLEAQDPWGFRCQDYRKLGFSCENLIQFYGYDCGCSCSNELKAMARAGTLPQHGPHKATTSAPAAPTTGAPASPDAAEDAPRPAAPAHAVGYPRTCANVNAAGPHVRSAYHREFDCPAVHSALVLRRNARDISCGTGTAPCSADECCMVSPRHRGPLEPEVWPAAAEWTPAAEEAAEAAMARRASVDRNALRSVPYEAYKF